LTHLATAITSRPAEQLSHHAGRLRPLGDSVTVTPMVGGEAIGTTQIGADAGRHRFLADRYVKRPGNFTCLVRCKRSLFEGANTRHRAVMVDEAA